MSKITKNGKNVIVEMAVSYDHKNDSIIITPHDEDMIGKPFAITLNYATDAEKSLRELLTENGVIKEEKLGVYLPVEMKHPNTFDENPYVFNIGDAGGELAQCNSFRDSNVLVSGDSRSGKTNLLKSFLKHAEYYDDSWEYTIVSPYLTKEFGDFTNSQITESTSNVEQLDQSLDLILKDLTNRLEKINTIQNKQLKFDIYADDDNSSVVKKKLILLDSMESVLPSMYLSNISDNTEKEQIAKVAKKLMFIYQNAQRVGYYIVLSTQKPTSISGEIKALMGTRIAMGRMNSEKSYMALGTSDGRRIPKGIGKGYLRIYGHGKFFQAYEN